MGRTSDEHKCHLRKEFEEKLKSQKEAITLRTHAHLKGTIKDKFIDELLKDESLSYNKLINKALKFYLESK